MDQQFAYGKTVEHGTAVMHMFVYHSLLNYDLYMLTAMVGDTSRFIM